MRRWFVHEWFKLCTNFMEKYSSSWFVECNREREIPLEWGKERFWKQNLFVLTVLILIKIASFDELNHDRCWMTELLKWTERKLSALATIRLGALITDQIWITLEQQNQTHYCKKIPKEKMISKKLYLIFNNNKKNKLFCLCLVLDSKTTIDIIHRPDSLFGR